MDPHPDDLTAVDDLALVHEARSGDRLAFGVLYLRHHAAAWRIACVTSRFSPDAELAVIEGFTRVFSALPAESEEFEAGGVTFRPYLLACVRQAALARARAAGRAEPGKSPRPGPASPPPSPAPLAGLSPDGEVVLSSLEHHVARAALAALPERARTAVWLSDVEAMTPNEVAGILGSDPELVTALAAEARAGVRSAQDIANGRHEVRADCRYTVDHLGAYHAGTLDPKKGVLVRSHLDLCPPCRMRLGELANAPATLAAAVPAAPLLGGEAQQHWLAAAAEVHPAERLLPPGLAAAAPAWHFPDVLRPVRDHRTHRVAGVAGAMPVVARKVGRRARPVVPALTLVVCWLAVMLSLPQLMEPETAPGPGGLALPAVQAYVPDYLPGAAEPSSGRGKAPSAPHSSEFAGAGGSSELAAQFTSEVGRAGAGGFDNADDQSTVGLIRTATSPRAGAPRPSASPPAPVAAAAEALPTFVPSAVPVVPLFVTDSSPITPAVADVVLPAEPAKGDKGSRPTKDSEPSKDSTTDSTTSKDSTTDKGSKPGKDSKQKDSKSGKGSKSDTGSKAGKDTKPRSEAKPNRKSEPDRDSKRSKESERKPQPVSRTKIVTA